MRNTDIFRSPSLVCGVGDRRKGGRIPVSDNAFGVPSHLRAFPVEPGHNVRMSEATLDLGQLLSRAQRGQGSSVITEVGELLDDAPLSAGERVRLLIILTVAHISVGRFDLAVDSAGQCLTIATAAGVPSWQASALALRGSAHQRLGRSNQALDDVIEAEVRLSRSAFDPAAVGAHVAIGHVYADLRLYELAEPHWALVGQAITVEVTPGGPWTEWPPSGGTDPDSTAAGRLRRGRVVDFLNLAGLHLTWDDELARLPDPDIAAERADHQHQARRWLDRIEQDAPGNDEWWAGAVVSARLDVESRIDPVGSLHRLSDHCRERLTRRRPSGPATAAATNGSDTELVALLSALSAAQRTVGDAPAAQETARIAVSLLAAPGIDPTVAKNAHYQLHRAQLAVGIAGSVSMRDFVTACDQELWSQRMDSVAGVRARRDFAILDRQHAVTSRLTLEDPLTRVFNRRAFTEWVEAHPTGPMTLVMVDLDDFKSINDRFGHAAGDQVLIRVAETLRTATRDHDLVARYGGDEFVVAFDHDHFELGDITERLVGAVAGIELGDVAPGLVVSATGGAAAAAFGESVSELLSTADQRMLEAKHARLD